MNKSKIISKGNTSKSKTSKGKLSKSKINKTQRNSKEKKKITRKKIGEGGYGCVYKPAFKCHDDNKVDNKVSKVMIERKVNDEINDYKRIDEEIDPQQKYHIGISKFSKGEKKCKLRDNVLDKILKGEYGEYCEELEDKLEDIKTGKEEKQNIEFINYKYGGLSLSKYIKQTKTTPSRLTEKEVKHILIGYLNLLEGVKVMLVKNFVHFDIKSDNIVYDSNIQGQEAMKFIDFGLSSDIFNISTTNISNNQIDIKYINDVYDYIEDKQYRYKSAYNAYPHEVILCRTKLFDIIIKHIVSNLEKSNDKFYKLDKNQLDEVIKYIRKNYDDENRDRKRIPSYLLKNNNTLLLFYIDIIYEIYKKFNGLNKGKYNQEQMNKIVFIYFCYKVFTKVDIYSMGKILEKLIKLFLNKLSSDTIKKFTNLIKQLQKIQQLLTDENCVKRIEITKVITEYKSIITKL